MNAGLDCSVVIVGAGPCGLMLAIELGRRGVSTIVLEEKTTPAGHWVADLAGWALIAGGFGVLAMAV